MQEGGDHINIFDAARAAKKMAEEEKIRKQKEAEEEMVKKEVAEAEKKMQEELSAREAKERAEAAAKEATIQAELDAEKLRKGAESKNTVVRILELESCCLTYQNYLLEI